MGVAERHEKFPALRMMAFFGQMAAVAEGSGDKYDVECALQCSEAMRKIGPISRDMMETWLRYM